MAVDCISKHRVFIHDRGGIQRLDELVDIQSVTYSRVRDQTSSATVKIASSNCTPQRAVLDRTIAGTGRFEAVIYRGDERAWEGPISITTDSGKGFELDAYDVTWYWDKTVMHAGYSNAYPNVDYGINRIKKILTTELARKEALGYNLLSYITYSQTTNDAKTTRVTKPYEKTVFGEIDDMASKSGIDYTVVGRQVIFWDTDQNIGQTAPLSNADFLGEGIIISSYASELITTSFATDGQGNVGSYGGNDPYYGEWENLQSPSQEAQDGPAPTVAQLQSQARANLAGKNPTPLIFRVGDGSSVNPTGVLQLGDFVPGVFMPMEARVNGREISQWMKLDQVTFSEDKNGETITVTLAPAPIGAVVI